MCEPFWGFVDYSDQHVEVALGFCAHLMLMLSKLLDLPLRYPIVHNGSKSTVFDLILEKLQDKERE